jgi:iron complex transport system permease protein
VFFLLGLLLLFMFFLDISFGSVTIPFQDVFSSLAGSQASKTTWEYIIINYRLPKAITALLVGTGLAVSGMLMQTLFRNPLAGPDVLGLSSGAILAVAIVILGAGFLPSVLKSILVSPYSIVLASTAGSIAVLLLVLMVAQQLRNTMAILIVGLMFGSFTGAIVGVLTYFSSAEQLQKFTFWALGSLGNLSWTSIFVLAITVGIGLVLSAGSIKALNALLLGENYAKSMGLNIRKSRFIIICATGLLAGSVTAFAGPIAFIGLAVPHIAKLTFQSSNHSILYVATILYGGIIMLFCDFVTQLPGLQTTLPINAVTSIIGAPVVVWLLMRKRSFQ